MKESWPFHMETEMKTPKWSYLMTMMMISMRPPPEHALNITSPTHHANTYNSHFETPLTTSRHRHNSFREFLNDTNAPPPDIKQFHHSQFYAPYTSTQTVTSDMKAGVNASEWEAFSRHLTSEFESLKAELDSLRTNQLIDLHFCVN